MVLSALFALATVGSYASQPWSKTYSEAKDDAFNKVIGTADGGYAAIGYTGSSGNGTGDNSSCIWLIKTDPDGNQLWNKTYGSAGQDAGYGIVQTADGGYAIAGYTMPFSNGTMKTYLARTDASGNLLWDKTYGGNQQSGAYSLAKTSDGGFILTGFDYVNDSHGWDVSLIKTDATGNVMWAKTYGGPEKEAGHYVEQTGDGGYIITGYTKSFGNQGGNMFGVGAEDLWLIKTDASGNEQWNRTFGGMDYDDGFSVNQLAEGGYIVAGTTKSFYPNGNRKSAYDVNDTARAYLIRTDAKGNELWNKTFGGNTDTAIFSMDVMQDGYVLTGTTFTDKGDADIIVLKADLNGTGLWGYTYGGQQDDYGYSICQADGGFAIAGSTKSFGNDGTDGYIIRINEDGTMSTVAPGTQGQSSPMSKDIILLIAIIAFVGVAIFAIRKRIFNK